MARDYVQRDQFVNDKTHKNSWYTEQCPPKNNEKPIYTRPSTKTMLSICHFTTRSIQNVCDYVTTYQSSTNLSVRCFIPGTIHKNFHKPDCTSLLPTNRTLSRTLDCSIFSCLSSFRSLVCLSLFIWLWHSWPVLMELTACHCVSLLFVLNVSWHINSLSVVILSVSID